MEENPKVTLALTLSIAWSHSVLKKLLEDPTSTFKAIDLEVTRTSPSNELDYLWTL